MADEVTQIELPDGTVVQARVTDTELLAWGSEEYTDTGFSEALTARVEGLTELVKGVATTMREATAAVAPDEVSVAFGVELAAKPGRVVSVLTDGEAKASVVVTLTWRDGRDRGRGGAALDGAAVGTGTDPGPAGAPDGPGH
ncbi:CU044_2847 family protein [Streptomyces sp. NBC_00878]|uniref:CU044_2847 family protein n=1 Tax=Streptomyces sp. NBC_00878 TaxID=2975854 RepID=UPI00224E1358|nr:CU044_2847 family protein [Streptomyces sp. NBC_00878]MCX4905500.1 CU044_2847 family protein [Streptomyces sp. NBC_00878]